MCKSLNPDRVGPGAAFQARARAALRGRDRTAFNASSRETLNAVKAHVVNAEHCWERKCLEIGGPRFRFDPGA